jgi:hypothetical protein
MDAHQVFKKLGIFAAACGVYSLATVGCLSATAAMSKHLSYIGCVDEAKLSLIDDAYCMYRQ